MVASSSAGSLPFSLVPFISLICFAVSFLYPAFKSLKLLYNLQNPTNITSAARVQEGPVPNVNFVPQYIQWICYWIIYSSFSFLETSVLFLVIPFIPLYLEIKTVCCFWLVYEEFNGAGWLWYRFLEHRYDCFDKLLISYYTRFCPDAAKRWLEQPKVVSGGGGGSCGGGGSSGGPRKGTFDSARDVASTIGMEALNSSGVVGEAGSKKAH